MSVCEYWTSSATAKFRENCSTLQKAALIMMQFKLAFLPCSLKGESVRLQPTALDQQWQHEAWGCNQLLLCGCYGIAQEDRDSDTAADEPWLKDI